MNVSYAHIYANPERKEMYCGVTSPWVIDCYYGVKGHFDDDYIETFGAESHAEAVQIANSWCNKEV